MTGDSKFGLVMIVLLAIPIVWVADPCGAVAMGLGLLLTLYWMADRGRIK